MELRESEELMPKVKVFVPVVLQALRSVGVTTLMVGGGTRVADPVALLVRSHTSPVLRGGLLCFTMMLADGVFAGQVYV
jgi:hypothetical protein